MKILIYGINYSPELTGIGKYSSEMATWLANNGNEVTVITAMPYYPHWQIQGKYRGKLWHKEIIDSVKVYRCPLYVPSNPTGFKRIIHDASFFLSSSIIFIKLLFDKKFDLLITVAPPFHLGLVSLIYRFFKGTPILYHIQDLQVDAAKELKIIKSNFLLSFLMQIEKLIINRVDYVSSISLGMIQKINNKSNREIISFPNWVDTTTFYPVIKRELLKPKWGFAIADKVILYSGSIGNKQGLESLIRIAEKLKHMSNIKFVICGTGPFKQTLIEMANQRKLENVYFFGLQEFNVFNEFLNMADLHLIIQKADASDLVMPSKLTTILSVGGLTLATANAGTSLYNEVNSHRLGIVVPAENDGELAKAIVEIINHDYDNYRINARKFAEKYLNKSNVIRELMRKVTLLP